jgi:SAM-dependent methyltransferase
MARVGNPATPGAGPGRSMFAKSACLVCDTPGRLRDAGCVDFLCGAEGLYDYLVCPSCRLLWISPQPDPLELERLYEAHYADAQLTPEFTEASGLKKWIREAVLGARDYPVGGSARRGHVRIAGRLLRLLPPVRHRAEYGMGLLFPRFRSGGRLLDVGCGHGWYVRILGDWGWDACGVEHDRGVARRGRALYAVRILDGGLEEQRFPDQSFDFVTLRHVFEHVSDPLATLAECRRILKPGGLLGLATPNGRSLGSRWFGRSWRGLTPPWHLHLFGPRSLRQVLQRAGFRVVALRTTAVSAHWIYPVSKQIREGTYGQAPVKFAWWFRGLEATLNLFSGELGEELEALASPAPVP